MASEQYKAETHNEDHTEDQTETSNEDQTETSDEDRVRIWPIKNFGSLQTCTCGHVECFVEFLPGVDEAFPRCVECVKPVRSTSNLSKWQRWQWLGKCPVYKSMFPWA